MGQEIKNLKVKNGERGGEDTLQADMRDDR